MGYRGLAEWKWEAHHVVILILILAFFLIWVWFLSFMQNKKAVKERRLAHSDMNPDELELLELRERRKTVRVYMHVANIIIVIILLVLTILAGSEIPFLGPITVFWIFLGWCIFDEKAKKYKMEREDELIIATDPQERKKRLEEEKEKEKKERTARHFEKLRQEEKKRLELLEQERLNIIEGGRPSGEFTYDDWWTYACEYTKDCPNGVDVEREFMYSCIVARELAMVRDRLKKRFESEILDSCAEYLRSDYMPPTDCRDPDTGKRVADEDRRLSDWEKRNIVNSSELEDSIERYISGYIVDENEKACVTGWARILMIRDGYMPSGWYTPYMGGVYSPFKWPERALVGECGFNKGIDWLDLHGEEGEKKIRARAGKYYGQKLIPEGSLADFLCELGELRREEDKSFWTFDDYDIPWMPDW